MMNRILDSWLVWSVAVFVSFFVWLVPAAWLLTVVIDFSWSGFTIRPAGDIGSRALIAASFWVFLVGWVLWSNFARPADILKYLGWMWLVVLGGASLIAIESLAARDGFVPSGAIDVAIGVAVMLLEVVLSILIGKKLFKSCFLEGRPIGYLRVLAVGFTGLATVKLGLFILMPGAHVRLSPPLFGG